MAFLPLSSAFLWISFGLWLVPEESKACNDFSSGCDFEFRNVYIEFVASLKPWSQSRSSCMGNGGQLLGLLSNSLKTFLSEISRGKNTGNLSWWLEKTIQEEGKLITKVDDLSKDLCTYMRLNPLQVMLSSCNQTRGFLCTHVSESSLMPWNTNNPTHARLKRSIMGMASNLGNIEIVLEEAFKELRRMETTGREPTNEARDDFIKYLLKATQNLTSEFALDNIDLIEQILKSSIGILFLSLEKCDQISNPNPMSLFESILEIFWEISLLLGIELGEQYVFKHPLGTIYQITVLPEDLGNLILGSVEDGQYVKFPSYPALEPHLQGQSRVTAQLSMFSYNPHPSNESISGMVSNVVLNGDQSKISLKNLTENIQIYLPRPNATELLNNTVELVRKTQSVTRMNISDPEMTIIFDVEPNKPVSLILTLSYESSDATINNETILNNTVGFRWFITPEMIHHSPGSWFVTTRIHQSSEAINVTLRMTSFMMKCLFWDIVRQRWSSDGCMVGEETKPELSQCLCNHLTLFGSSFFVMPNYVDITRTAELFATVNRNYVVLALLCAFFGVYLLTLLWACIADRRARKRRKLTLLDDNHPGAQYNYLISIATGHRKSAGTSANVTAALIGSEGESSLHDLIDPEKQVFERGNVDMFILAAPFPLGDLRAIRLQHNNAGSHPSWYINKVVVQDLQTRHVWHFLCNCWLSADKDDGITKKTFNAAQNHEIASFRNIFQSRTWTGFRDEHIWVSIVDPPSRSPFTRAQRVSCCMCLLLCTMAINIAFWNLPVDDDAAVLFSLGSYKLTWQEVIVGVESGLLMFPINILIITIFRSIRPRIVSKSKKDKEEEGDAKPPAVTVPTLLRDTQAVISLTCTSERNQMSEVAHLQTTADLLPALDRLHVLIQNIQGETESNPHWVYCSQFLLAGLCHLLMCLDKLDDKHFSSFKEYQQILALTNRLVCKTEMVFSSHLTECPSPVRRKKKSVSCWLPWWCVFLGWFLLLSISGVSTFFTLLYGFQYGKEKSIKWVMSLGLSLFQSIFILQPLKVIGVAVIFALMLKPVAVEESGEVDIVLIKQQEKCKQYTGRVTL